jgi:hypothetical protein
VNCPAPLHLALVHFPVADRLGREVASAVTHLDVHDLARLVRTYGLERGWLVSPQPGQQALIKRLLDHWQTDTAKRLRPHRPEALALVSMVPDLATLVREATTMAAGQPPLVVATSATPVPPQVTFASLRQMIFRKERGIIILFGTGWGLGPSVVNGADLRLEPITGRTGYNHLSVRSAMSIVVDRLLGDRGVMTVP